MDFFPGIVGLVISCEPETFQKSSLGYVECRKKLTLRDVEDSQVICLFFLQLSEKKAFFFTFSSNFYFFRIKKFF